MLVPVPCYLGRLPNTTGASSRNVNPHYLSLNDLATKRGLKIVNLNIRSLFPKIAQVEALLEDEGIDVFNLNESWLSPSISNNLLRVNNYKLYRQDRALNKKGGGLCVFVSKNLKINVQTYDNLNVSNEHMELLVLTIQQKCTKPITLVSVYRPPQGKQTVFIVLLRNTLKNIPSGSKIVLTGDFNIDYATTNCKSTRELKNLEREFVLDQKILYPTRVTARSRTIIDHMCTNIDDIAEAGVIKSEISDHYATYVIIKKLKTVVVLRHFSADFKTRRLQTE